MWRWLGLGAVVAVVAFSACGNDDHYVYTARKYDPDRSCFQAFSSVDLIAGDDVSSQCAPVCFTVGKDVYTSTVCPPLPTFAVALDAEAPPCKAAACNADAGPDGLDAGDAGD